MKELWHLIKGRETEGNVVPFRGRQSQMIIAEGTDGLMHLVPEQTVQLELPEGKVIDMFPGVPYEIMGVTGMEDEPFDPPPSVA